MKLAVRFITHCKWDTKVIRRNYGPIKGPHIFWLKCDMGNASSEGCVQLVTCEGANIHRSGYDALRLITREEENIRRGGAAQLVTCEGENIRHN